MSRGLNKSTIVDSALDLLNEVGWDGLTVRALATRLGVQAPALYWHVKNKQELLDEMATEIWRRIGERLAERPVDSSWNDDLRDFAAILRSTLLAYRDGAKAFSGTYLTDSAVLKSQETSFARWIEQGFALTDVVRAFSLLYSFTVGFCIEEQAISQDEESGDDRYALSSRAERLDVGQTPLVAESGQAIFADPQARFDDLVDVIVETVGRMRSQSSR